MEKELGNTNGNEIHNLEKSTQQDFEQSKINVVFQNHQKSFNEVRDNYTEVAYNDNPNKNHHSSDIVAKVVENADRKKYKKYDYEKNSPPVIITDDFNRIHKNSNGPNSPNDNNGFSRRNPFGTAEAPELSKRALKLQDVNEKRKNLKLPQKNKRLINVDSKRRLQIKKEKHTLTESQYNKRIFNEYKKFDSIRYSGRWNARKLINDGNINEDEDFLTMEEFNKQAIRRIGDSLRHNVRNLRSLNNPYAKIRSLSAQEEILAYKRTKYVNKQDYKLDRENAKRGKNSSERKKKQQRAQQNRKQKEGNFLQRKKQQFSMGKKVTAQRIQAIKKTVSTILSSLSIITVLIMIIMIVFLLALAFIDGATETYANAVTQNDYYVISDSTAYFRKLETDLEEKLNDRGSLESELKETYGNDIYEFIYDLADFGFRADTIMAYLSARYGSFNAEEVKTELEALFDEMYKLTYEIKMEYRDIPYYDANLDKTVYRKELKKICYIILRKRELEDVVEGRLPDDLKEQYKGYKISTGGQQVYGPVIQEDWTNLISSNYGERIHPITGERTFHKGVDVAIPTGTRLYSAVEGEVIVAKYSETAGNYVTVRTDTGWEVTFMHMDSIAVTVGQEVEQGEFVGRSGNTGRSTGSHLHLQVEDAEGNTINPIFIVPQTCVVRTSE